MKRSIDIVGGVVLAAIAVPVIAVAVVASAFALRTWPLFVQRRVGRDGREFRFLKIRTLPAEAPRYANKYAVDSIPIPRISHFLRRSKIDELPQLFLVPLGIMSLVGPRPEMPGLHDDLDPEFAEMRTQVRPGCTGLWQVGTKCDRLIGEAPEFDRVYVAHQNLRLDLWILGRTVRFLVARRATDLDEIPNWALRPRADLETLVGPTPVLETVEV